MDYYNIGDLCVSWECEEYEVLKGEYFERFRIYEPCDLEKIRFSGRIMPLSEYDNAERLLENYSYELLDLDKERLLIYHWAHNRNGFAVWPDRIDADKENVCYFDPALQTDVALNMDWFMGLSGLHKALMQKSAYILHGSYIDYNGTAILFSAPSGTGKSTQADLWEKYVGAEIINGDRVLLRKRKEVWHAFGFPSCGSSDVCVNRTLPVGAIVILKQDSENRIGKLSLTEQIRNIIAATEFYHWDSEEMEKVVKFAQSMVFDVPVIQLSCRPDQDAVKLLKDYLQEEGICR